MNQTTRPSRLAAMRYLLACAFPLFVALGIGLAAPAEASRTGGSGPALSGVVNVNTATPDQLQLLPGVGESRARAIVALRKERGAFEKVEDLLAVKGIGESMLARMRPFVAVTGKTTARRL